MTVSPSRPVLGGTPDGMDEADAELLALARDLLHTRYAVGRHEVASAFRLADGSVVTGLHVESSSGRASVCAETAAISAAAIAGESVCSVVSVLRRPVGTEHLIEPCGVCAELLLEHASEARVWVAAGEGHRAIAVTELLPFAHVRTGRRGAVA
ncbi:cytidine deaminase [Microbacterium enclense]|uniref:Cytidine deaminase n=1 Tax=Microbacterium enclense TaxID=993073 RepID=A0A3S3P6E1_9MICO|nr:cytidine deaminase [Microbacterium enclense]RWR21966.1 cytidine deaminase [Microbacterium enclense]